MTVIRCCGCGAELPDAAFDWPSGTEFCSVSCATRAGATDAVLKVLRQRQEQASK